MWFVRWVLKVAGPAKDPIHPRVDGDNAVLPALRGADCARPRPLVAPIAQFSLHLCNDWPWPARVVVSEGEVRMDDETCVYRGRVIDVALERVELPNGHRAELEIVRHPGGAAVVALDERHRVCLLYQYRYVAGGWLWELPAGKIDGGEAPVLTAHRELAEEAGVKAAHWLPMGRMVSSPGVFSESVYLYLARQLTPADAVRDAHEVFEVHWVPFDEALEQARSGEIVDAKTIIGLFRAQALLAQGE